MEPELVYYLTCHVVLVCFHTVPVDETDELFMLSWLVDQHWLTLSFQQFIFYHLNIYICLLFQIFRYFGDLLNFTQIIRILLDVVFLFLLTFY